MLRFGSKWTYVPRSEDERTTELRYDDAALVSAPLHEQQHFLSITASPVAPLAPGAAASSASPPPPPPPPSPAQPLPSPASARARTRRVQLADTNVFTIDLSFLAQGAQIATGDPLMCECGAVLSSVDRVERDAEGAQTWTCRFCSRSRAVCVSDDELPASSTVDYVLSAPTASAASAEPSSASAEESTSVVFCVDVSGSMCVTYEMEGAVRLRGDAAARLAHLNEDDSSQWLPGQRRDVTYVSRLQAVQGAIDAQLAALARDHPTRTVGLVAFNSEVTVLGDGTQESRTIAGDKLGDYEALLAEGSAYALASDVRSSRDALVSRLFALEEGGQTALGPALVVSVAMASRARGSSVVVCTDGLSNVGLGGIDSLDDDAARARVEKFYEDVGALAQSRGVSVSVVSIAGAEANVEQLGRLAELTGGAVSVVQPTELARDFGNIVANAVIATDVSAQIILHPGMTWAT
eukprot:m51a1_g13541 putative type a von willebrand factor domain-containing protein (466) ;mRNA; f:261-2200